MQHEVLTQRAAEPCQQVMMLSTTMRTGSSSFFDSTLWWTGEAVIASTEITSDVHMYLCPIKQTSVLTRSFYHLRKQFIT